MSDTAAILLLSGYAVVTVLVIAWRIRRYDVDALRGCLLRQSAVCRADVAVAFESALPLPSDDAALVIANHTSETRSDAVVDESSPRPGPHNVRTISF
ncbi:MAG: hypothetical protein Ct9H300mP1_08340 [Planctomycetaceae bacterium]|nr:MAG: hypothetical protein Ct9H300mP1_08340 [Planctomycetaceae bacterium]